MSCVLYDRLIISSFILSPGYCVFHRYIIVYGLMVFHVLYFVWIHICLFFQGTMLCIVISLYTVSSCTVSPGKLFIVSSCYLIRIDPLFTIIRLTTEDGDLLMIKLFFVLL